MANDGWTSLPFDKAVQINPAVSVKRGLSYPFVDMQAIDPALRNVYSSDERKFKGGGSKFINGDTLMARITPCLENGKIARYAAPNNQQTGHGSTEFIVIRGRPNVTDNEFAYYLTKWKVIRQYCISQMTGSSGRQRVPTKSLSYYEVNIPPIKVQKAISCILGELDNKIELNKSINDTHESIAKAIFKNWFVDYEPVHKKNKEILITDLKPEIAILFPDEFKNSKIGKIPNGWNIMGLNETASFINGLALQKYPPEYDEGLPVIKIAQLRKGDTDGADRASSRIDAQYIVEDGDILFSWSGSLECVLWTGGHGALNQHLFKVTSERFPMWFIYLWIYKHLPMFRQIALSKATTMGHIQRHHLAEAKVVIPTPQLLSQANQIIEPIVDSIVARSLECRYLSQIRDTLLPLLMSGKLSIPDAERIVGRFL